MDVVALILAILAVIAGLLAAVPPANPTRWRTRFGTVGVAVALFAASWIVQLVNLTGTHVHVIHH